MELEYYKQILKLFADKPDLASLKERDNVAGNWPLLLKSVVQYDDRSARIIVSDSKIDFYCDMSGLDLDVKLKTIDAGQVIFLDSAKVLLNKVDNSLKIKAKTILTLKEFNDIQNNSSNKGTVVKNNIEKVDKNKLKADNKKENLDYKWRTLGERWIKQGKY
jgi:hypothetical protein